MKQRHFTIPIFIPEAACPNRCIFCNQHKIASTSCAPSVDEVIAKVEEHLITIPDGSEVEIGFFGGNFTGINTQMQDEYLQSVQKYYASGQVSGIRISTRPDYIDNKSLERLKNYNVKAIELGAQSLNEDVLFLSGRGHSIAQVEESAKLIVKNGFELGLQMMIGLPGDTIDKSRNTAKKIIELGALTTRIYPTLVIRDTQLEKMYEAATYLPLSLEEAVHWVAEIVPLFVQADVKVLRIGLHPSEGLLNKTSLVAGPFHVAFGEMVQTEIWKQIIDNLTFDNGKRNLLTLTIPIGMRNAAIGHKATNKAMLLQTFRKVDFVESSDLKGYNYHAHTR